MTRNDHEDELLEGLLVEPEIKFGNVMKGQFQRSTSSRQEFDELTSH